MCSCHTPKILSLLFVNAPKYSSSWALARFMLCLHFEEDEEISSSPSSSSPSLLAFAENSVYNEKLSKKMKERVALTARILEASANDLLWSGRKTSSLSLWANELRLRKNKKICLSKASDEEATRESSTKNFVWNEWAFRNLESCHKSWVCLWEMFWNFLLPLCCCCCCDLKTLSSRWRLKTTWKNYSSNTSIFSLFRRERDPCNRRVLR